MKKNIETVKKYCYNKIPDLKNVDLECKKDTASNFFLKFKFGELNISIYSSEKESSGITSSFYFFQNARNPISASYSFLDYARYKCGDKNFYKYLDKLLDNIAEHIAYMRREYNFFM